MSIARVDFYVIEAEDPRLLKVTACRLVEKVYKQGFKVFVGAQNEEEASMVDDLLWTFRQGSFVPHERFGAHDSRTPVLVGSQVEMPSQGLDVYVNLAEKVPQGIDKFRRIADFVDQTPAIRQAGRLRYKAYKNQGLELLTHTI